MTVRFSVRVYDWNGQKMLVDAHDMEEQEARDVLWTFVRKATQHMDDERAMSAFLVHAHRYEQ